MGAKSNLGVGGGTNCANCPTLSLFAFPGPNARLAIPFLQSSGKMARALSPFFVFPGSAGISFPGRRVPICSPLPRLWHWHWEPSSSSRGRNQPSHIPHLTHHSLSPARGPPEAEREDDDEGGQEVFFVVAAREERGERETRSWREKKEERRERIRDGQRKIPELDTVCFGSGKGEWRTRTK